MIQDPRRSTRGAPRNLGVFGVAFSAAVFARHLDIVRSGGWVNIAVASFPRLAALGSCWVLGLPYSSMPLQMKNWTPAGLGLPAVLLLSVCLLCSPHFAFWSPMVSSSSVGVSPVWSSRGTSARDS